MRGQGSSGLLELAGPFLAGLDLLTIERYSKKEVKSSASHLFFGVREEKAEKEREREIGRGRERIQRDLLCSSSKLEWAARLPLWTTS